MKQYRIGFWGEDGWFYPKNDADSWPVAVTAILRLTKDAPNGAPYGIEKDGEEPVGLGDLQWFAGDSAAQLECVVDITPVRIYWIETGIPRSIGLDSVSVACDLPSAICPWDQES